MAKLKLNSALDDIVYRSLRPVAMGLAMLYSVLAISHGLVLPETIAPYMIVTALLTALILFGLYCFLRKRPVPGHWIYPLALGIAGLVLINSFLHLYLSAEPRQTTNLMLLIIGVGFFFLSTPWFAFIVIVTLAGWGLMVELIGPSPLWLHFGFALFQAVVVAILVHIVHLRSLRRSEGLRLRNEHQNAELRESEERFRQLVEHLDEVFWIASADGSQVLYVSPAYEKVRGHPCRRLYEHPTDWIEAIHPEDRPRLHDVHARITTGEFSEEYRIIRPDSTVRWIWSRGFPIRDAFGKVERIAGIAQDITERKQAEERLRQQQAELVHMARFALGGEMASGLAHELNQPLCAIRSYTEACLLLIGSGKIESEPLSKAMEKVAIQAQRAGEIIHRLRNLMQKTEPRRSAVDINALIQDIIPLLEPEARQQEVQIQLELDQTLPQLLADGIQIQQVVLNLMHNAIEAMAESRTKPRVLSLRTTPAGSDALEVTVSDTGQGLSSEEMERLFMPFFTTKPTGMGLGLSISQSIIEVHKGQLWATRNPDRGITFHFTLPYNPSFALFFPAGRGAGCPDSPPFRTYRAQLRQ